MTKDSGSSATTVLKNNSSPAIDDRHERALDKAGSLLLPASNLEAPIAAG